ncbi:MAG: glycine--tRNA ligase subunit alpha [candidate division WOR-3 bacterium]|nr:MAG: glycine--tRNA ligase subunit alpha [candidate division WOR-3 bacterium]
MTMQELMSRLLDYWASQGCAKLVPYNSEVGAATFNPFTFLRVLDSTPWNVVYHEPCKRPRDGRYGKNPLRVQQFYQVQVIMKPSPPDIQDRYLGSLRALGIDLKKNDIRFTEDDWDSPTIGAWGLGWQVDLNGIEITQFTYFQQCGSIDLKLIPVELSYGIERIAMFLQDVDSIMDVKWNRAMTWGDVYRMNEEEWSAFNLEEADVALYRDLFEKYESEAKRLLDKGLVLPGYDHVIKCSHFFNLLEARGSISVSERQKYIGRVRRLARQAAFAYLNKVEPEDPAGQSPRQGKSTTG